MLVGWKLDDNRARIPHSMHHTSDKAWAMLFAYAKPGKLRGRQPNSRSAPASSLESPLEDIAIETWQTLDRIKMQIVRRYSLLRIREVTCYVVRRSNEVAIE